MPERIQRVSEVAQSAQTATYVSGGAGVGIGVATKSQVFDTMLWLQENAWLVSMTFMILTFFVMLIFRILEYRLKLQAEKRAQEDFIRRKTDLKLKRANQNLPDN